MDVSTRGGAAQGLSVSIRAATPYWLLMVSVPLASFVQAQSLPLPNPFF